MTSSARPPGSRDAYRDRLYRLLFATAAAYNLAFGTWAALAPLSFFRLFDLPPPRYPAIWACLGMVVGLYGLVYAHAARHLDHARPLIAIGLLGKVVGPLGWVLTVRSGEWPIRTFTLVMFNDLIWWMPFGLFLLEGTRLGDRVRRSAPYACGAINLAAALAMLFLLRPGTEVVADWAMRAAYIARHPVAWRGGWALWIAAAISLLGFYCWWGARVAPPTRAVVAVGVAGIGLCCDLLAESVFIAWLPDYGGFQRAGSLLTGAAANGLYTVAGIILTLGTPGLEGAFATWTWAIWTAGAALSIAALAGHGIGIAVATGVLFALFCPWTIVLARRLS